MRTAARLLAIVKPERFLEAGNPTGLTGLYTHPNPRPTLLLLYDETLERLKSFPEHSVYRQAAEAVTRHRMNILNSIKPSGYNEWAERARKLIEENKAYIRKIQESQIEADAESRPPGNYKVPSTPIDHNEADDEYVDTVEWDGQKAPNGLLDGVRSSEEGADQKYLVQMRLASIRKGLKWEDEPPLEASQIADIENQIGGGLIEEVIQVAEGESQLATSLAKSKVWEQLEEKAPHGQWEYFARDQHTPGTQETPK